MKIGIGNYYCQNYGYDEGCKRMLSHGFNCVDYSLSTTNNDFYKKDGKDLEIFVSGMANELRSRGIDIVQTHGLWEIPCDADDKTPEDRLIKFAKMSRGILCTKLLGAKYIAFHPIMPFGIDSPDNPEEVYRINKEYYSKLAEVAMEHGITVCIENMPFKQFPLSDVPSILALVKDVNHPNFKFCLDTGHANIFPLGIGDAVRMIGKDYLKILHVHDNDGNNDLHWLPRQGTLNWDDFTLALAQIGFDGVFNIETNANHNKKKGGDTDEIELALAKVTKELAEAVFK